MKKIAITGANGMLGSSITSLFKKEFEIIGLTREQMPIDNYKAVQQKIGEIQPDVIIHCAAYTNVEQAETNATDCYLVNQVGTLNLANAARNNNCKLIYISSTGCYGAYKDVAYREYDTLEPGTIYHQSKLAGEKEVSSICNNYLILRTGWLYGGSISHKKNFVYNRYLEAKKSDKMTSDPFQTGNPTSVVDVAHQIKVLLEEEVCGTFNVVSEGSCSRYEYVKAIIELCKLDTVVQKADQPFKRIAPVSNNEAAENFLLKSMGLSVMRPWKESLAHYIDTMLQDANQ